LSTNNTNNTKDSIKMMLSFLLRKNLSIGCYEKKRIDRITGSIEEKRKELATNARIKKMLMYEVL
jgi:hypothetical protein